MSNLSSALEGLRQAEKQLQWVKYAQDIIDAAQDAENRKNAAKLEFDKLTADHKALKEQHEKLRLSVSELFQKEAEAAKKAELEEKHLASVEQEVLQEVEKANETAKKLHDQFIEHLNKSMDEKQDEVDAHAAKLNESIALLEEKKSAIEADIVEISKKWS